MNQTAQAVAKATRVLSTHNPAFYGGLVEAIGNEDFTDGEKLALGTVIVQQTRPATDSNSVADSVARNLLAAVLYSDFAEFLPAPFVPTVDAAFRTKILAATKARLIAELENATAELAAIKAAIEQIEDEDLLAELTEA